MSLSSTEYPISFRLRTATVVVFCTTMFLSAGLLFFVQPLFTKLALPKIGGAPAVWTTAMLFFQVILILGYVYAHLLTKWLPLRWQLCTHITLWLAALLFLPLSASDTWGHDPSRSTTLQTLELFAIGVGLPFAVLSANAPLLQAWYTRSNGPSRDDPYFLYSASNVGSLLALLAFPLLADPLLGAKATSTIWFFGFILFGGLLLISGLMAMHGPGPAVTSAERHTSSHALNPKQIAIWIAVAFVPSSLMLSITTKVSTDLGSIPLIWVVPLAVYILSFVVAFATWKKLTTDSLRIPVLLALAVGAVLLSNLVSQHAAPITILAYVPVLFVIALFAHRLLYERRPPADQLTVFYIALSVGGALGGLFNSIIAPAVFFQEIEAQITLILAGGLLLLLPSSLTPRNVMIGLLTSIPVLCVFGVFKGFNFWGNGMSHALAATLVLAVILLLFRNSLVRAAVLLCVVMLPSLISKQETLFQDRSFFGTHQVFSLAGLRVYRNGTTIHGWQKEEDFGKRPTPLTYYHPKGPMAQVITSEFGQRSEHIGIVGLGTGALACYKQPSQTWSFFEIDAMVDQVARDPSMFTYLSECAPESETYLGDARVVLAQNPFEFDILVLDAYSSDAIPLHLMTQEAVKLYTERLTEDGVLVFHISNNYYDLIDPLARISGSLGLHAATQFHTVKEEDKKSGALSSIVAIVSPDKSLIDGFIAEGNWTGVTSDGETPWTDDKANLISALKLLK
ncbi:fused MFS/spermidine synthase [Ruegeria sp.]|uniref:fused MFS/spermidine synthase n=1 Tax=Ruegeria sp. TaxID=1879320 RepID=UPI0023106A85|nr:fused MFS/spermidine synthase [Ruegeria sp.]MDA7965626.1 fused MFS/spermidine synthase [Ruegeria sp.]MDA7967148.1 fused MFS/spermidine synthase [Ruegeria sp.]